MKRKTAIRNLVIISAGTLFLPACRVGNKPRFPLRNFSLSRSEEEMLEELAEAILPGTANFAGAKDLKSHEFLLTMIDDCTSPEGQKKFKVGLKAFDELSHVKFGQLFTGFTADQKKSLLADLESKKGVPEEALGFYQTVKRYTLQSFTTSKKYMVEIRKYNMVPGGNFKGCVKV